MENTTATTSLLSTTATNATITDNADAEANSIIAGAIVGAIALLISSVVLCFVSTRLVSAEVSDMLNGAVKLRWFKLSSGAGAAQRPLYALESDFYTKFNKTGRYWAALTHLLRNMLRAGIIVAAALNVQRLTAPNGRLVLREDVSDNALLPLLATATVLVPWRRVLLRWWLLLIFDAVVLVCLVLFGVACADCVSATRFPGIIVLALAALDQLCAISSGLKRLTPIEPVPHIVQKATWHAATALATGTAVFLAVAGQRAPLAVLAVFVCLADTIIVAASLHKYAARTQNLVVMIIVAVSVHIGAAVAIIVAGSGLFEPSAAAVIPIIVGGCAAMVHSFVGLCCRPPGADDLKPKGGLTAFNPAMPAGIRLPPKPPPPSIVVMQAAAPANSNTAEAQRATALDDVEIDAGELVNLREIGQGSFGLVYRAEYRFSDVAVKCVNDNAFGDETDLLTEARTLRQLPTHANVVAFRGLCRLKARPALVLEFCDGGSLYSALRSRDIVWTRAKELRVLAGVAAGVAHLHKCGIVHRDLAARNILLASLRTMEPKVTDFGMSRRDDVQSTKTSLGAAGWMAPEQMARVDAATAAAYEFSTASDVFSFAVVLFEVVEKKTPWEGYAGIDIRDKVSKGQRLKVNEALYDTAIAKIMDSCWSYLPAQRPSMEAVAGKLREASASALMVSARDVDDDLASQRAASSGALYDNEATPPNGGSAVYDNEAPPNEGESAVYDDEATPPSNQPLYDSEAPPQNHNVYDSEAPPVKK
jgi:serine/threonine protein kinase